MAVWLFPDAAANSTCATPISSSQATVILQSTAGFGTIAVGQQMGGVILDTGNPGWSALTNGGLNPLAAPFEYVFITGNNLGTNTLNWTRGQAGTTAKNFYPGATVAATLLGEALVGSMARIDGGPGTITNINGLAATMGPPTSGTFATGTIWIDSKGAMFVCTLGGTPGTWLYVGGGPYHAEVFQNAAQSVPNAVYTQIAFDSIEGDPNTNFTTGAAAHYTCPIAGVYRVSGSVWFLSPGAVNFLPIFGVYKNGLQAKLGSRGFGNNTTASATGSYAIRCNAADALAVYAYQDSGAALNTAAGATQVHAQFRLEASL